MAKTHHHGKHGPKSSRARTARGEGNLYRSESTIVRRWLEAERRAERKRALRAVQLADEAFAEDVVVPEHPRTGGWETW